jgi:hypothetical protein
MKASHVYAGFVVIVMSFGFEGCTSNSSSNTNKTSRSPMGECNSSSSSSDAPSCTGEDAYAACLQKACGTQYQACLGPNYLSGTYGGTCKTEMNCLIGCPCEDTSCAMACYDDASTACIDCLDAADSCEQQSGCVEPVCGNAGAGGNSSLGTGGATASGGSASTLAAEGGTSSTVVGSGGSSEVGVGGTAPIGVGGSPSPTVCPYAAATVDCTQACTNLKAIATKCQSEPSLSTEIQTVLQLANSGTGTACRAGCAADSPMYAAQWKCFQAVPTAADCTAIAGCTVFNCPP